MPRPDRPGRQDKPEPGARQEMPPLAACRARAWATCICLNISPAPLRTLAWRRLRGHTRASREGRRQDRIWRKVLPRIITARAHSTPDPRTWVGKAPWKARQALHPSPTAVRPMDVKTAAANQDSRHRLAPHQAPPMGLRGVSTTFSIRAWPAAIMAHNPVHSPAPLKRDRFPALSPARFPHRITARLDIRRDNPTTQCRAHTATTVPARSHPITAPCSVMSPAWSPTS